MGMWITSTAVLGYSFTHDEVRKALGEEDNDEDVRDILDDNLYSKGIEFIHTDDKVVVGLAPEYKAFEDSGSEWSNEGFEIPGWTATQVLEIRNKLSRELGLNVEDKSIKLFVHSECS